MKGRTNSRSILPHSIVITDIGPAGYSSSYPDTVVTTFEDKSLVRSYGITRNPPPSAKVRPPPVQKIPLLVMKPAEPRRYKRVRYKSGGKWLSRLKLVKVPTVVYVYPKRKGPKRRKTLNKRKTKRAYRHPNELSTWAYRTIVQSPSYWYAMKETEDGTYERSLSGNMCLQPVPFGPFYGSGDHRPDFVGLASTEQAKSYFQLYDKVVGGFYDDLKDQSVNFAQALAELKQTTSMIANMAVRAASALRNLKRGNLKAVSKALGSYDSKDLANDWLVYQYGIKPLLQDIDGMAKHLAQSIHGLPKIQAKKSAQYKDSFFEQYEFSSGAAGSSQLSIETESYMKIGCNITIDLPVLHQASQLGFTNLPALGWELVPYSFVADWFFPIGDFLNRLDATTGLLIDNIYFTYFVKQKVTLTVTPSGEDANGYKWTGSPCVLNYENVTMDRTVPQSLPPPPTPTFKNPFSLSHIANATALFRQLKH